MALDTANLLLDVLSEDVLLRMCLFLPGRALMDMSMASRMLKPQADDSPTVWRSLCNSLLGSGLVQLHQEAWADSAEASDGTASARFFKSLFRAAYDCRRFSYSLPIRRRCLEGGTFSGLSFSPPSRSGDDITSSEIAGSSAASSSDIGGLSEDSVVLRDERSWERALAVSGPSSVAVGHLVINIGGSIMHQADIELLVCVINVAHGAILRPRLSAASLRPARRTRHTSCVVRPSGRQAGQSPPVLVLGGCNDMTSQPCAGGLKTLLYMELLRADGSEICWREEVAEGDAPDSIWHHVCGSFAQGRKVVVFGGDMSPDDAEFPCIRDRRNAGHVYVLDVDARRWERVATGGNVPAWRSLHKGVTYTSLADGSDRLVIVGGCVTHVPLHGQGELAEMVGCSLHLGTFQWQQGGNRTEDAQVQVETFRPRPRMRFAADRYGRHMLVYGGHDVNSHIPPNQQLLALNLMTLRWGKVEETNRPHSFRYVPGSSLAGGVLTGGFDFDARFGIRLVPKFDIIYLAPPATGDDAEREEATGRGSEGESFDDEAVLAQHSVWRPFGGDQHNRVVFQFPASATGNNVLAFLRRQLGGLDPRVDNESSDEEED